MYALVLCLIFSQKPIEKTMPFIKADVSNSENVKYTKECLQQIIRTVGSKPVYMFTYENNVEKDLFKVGDVTCCFMDGDWIAARMDLLKPVPANYVLRAHVRATKAKTLPDNTYVVEEVEIVKFYLKDKNKAVRYEDDVPKK